MAMDRTPQTPKVGEGAFPKNPNDPQGFHLQLEQEGVENSSSMLTFQCTGLLKRCHRIWKHVK